MGGASGPYLTSDSDGGIVTQSRVMRGQSVIEGIKGHSTEDYSDSIAAVAGIAFDL